VVRERTATVTDLQIATPLDPRSPIHRRQHALDNLVEAIGLKAV
jgi:hypothetical protein